MKNLVLSMIALAGLTAACGSSFPTPTDRLAASEAAIRSAKELGAQNDPQAALHVKLADEQVASAKNLMHDGDNRRADLVLQRADSDAELAVMMTREKQAKTAADQAKANLNGQRAERRRERHQRTDAASEPHPAGADHATHEQRQVRIESKAMRTFMNTKILFGAALTALSAVACGPTIPPKELADARTQYQMSAQGPAATESPAQLHNAKVALDQAESAFAKDGDKPWVKDEAYVALRKAQLADVMAQVQMQNKAKTQADIDAQKLQASQLQNAEHNLAKTQDQLDAEKNARAEAERRAAQALADLQRIASVKQETRGMVITLSGSVLFATDQSVLLPAAVSKLNDVADALTKGNPDSNITIEGHTDSTGTHDHNMVLSQQRAEAVKGALVARGVAPDRIQTVGVGPDRPIADNKTPEGRANNRRVEIIVSGGNPSSTTTTTTHQ